MKSIYILIFCLVSGVAFAQIESIEDANAQLKEELEKLETEIDKTTATFDSMDAIADDLKRESNAMKEQIKEAEQKIEAAEKDLESEKNERAEWAYMVYILIVSFGVMAIVFIFNKRRKNS